MKITRAKFFSFRSCPFCAKAFWPISSKNDHCSLECALLSRVHVRGSDQCWEFTGTRNKKGYGVFGFDNSSYLAPRAMWMLFKGPIQEGFCVCHHCDNPPCCNPGHFFTGTNNDNVLDSVAKGRRAQCKGELAGRAKLTVAQVLSIRSRQETDIELGKEFGVHYMTVHCIRTRNSWSHV